MESTWHDAARRVGSSIPGASPRPAASNAGAAPLVPRPGFIGFSAYLLLPQYRPRNVVIVVWLLRLFYRFLCIFFEFCRSCFFIILHCCSAVSKGLNTPVCLCTVLMLWCGLCRNSLLSCIIILLLVEGRRSRSPCFICRVLMYSLHILSNKISIFISKKKKKKKTNP